MSMLQTVAIVYCNIVLMCLCKHSGLCNDLYCVGWDTKPYSFTHSV